MTSALEVFLNVMRCINPRFTYLLTYLLTYLDTTELTVTFIVEVTVLVVLGRTTE